MDGASLKQSQHHIRGASLEGTTQRIIQSKLHEHAIRLLKEIALLLISAVAIGLLVCATLALVGLPCPNAYRTWLGDTSMWISNITERHAQSDSVGAAVARAYVAVCPGMSVSRRTALS
jgi:hypothetical protein